MRELYKTKYIADQFTDENVLYKGRLIEPERLSRAITWLYGKNSEKMPMLYFTEGQGNFKKIKPKKLNDTQYTWPVFGKMKHTSKCLGLVNANNAAPGINFSSFEADFEDNWLINMHTVYTPDQQHQVRVQGEPRAVGGNRYRYTFIILTGNAEESIPLDNFAAGSVWVMGAPTTTASKGDGNRSNTMTPGEYTNQFGYHRFSKQIAGNVANKVVVYEFDTKGGGKTNAWMPFEMLQFELDRKLMLETDLWHSEYNRDANGVIHNKDNETGEPIPKGAGVKEIITSIGNHDTYYNLTANKLDAVINRIFSNRIGETPTEMICYAGAGGKRMVHKGLASEASSNLFFEKVGMETISGKDGYLQYGQYFQSYKTIDGKVLTITETELFNHGLHAEQDRLAGNMIDGFPKYSYNIVFIDHSMTSDGDRNIQLVYEDGQEFITGIYKGMSPVPKEWGAINDTKWMGTRKDIATYEIKQSLGINIYNPTTSFWLEYAG
jgi:hypothetical protein